MKAIENRVRDIIAKAIEAKRDDDQDGYHNVVDGEFQQILQIQFSPEDANVLAAFVGVVPDGITVLGDCGDCVYGDAHGGDMGWNGPCCSCSRPKMPHFVPLASLSRASLDVNERQARMLQNYLDRAWWATGLCPPHDAGEEWSMSWAPYLDKCESARKALFARDMLIGISPTRVTNKGMSALKRHNEQKGRSAA